MPGARVSDEQVLAWLMAGRSYSWIQRQGVGPGRISRLKTSMGATSQPATTTTTSQPATTTTTSQPATTTTTHPPSQEPTRSPGARSATEILIEIERAADEWFSRLASQHVAIGNWMTRRTGTGRRRVVDRASVSRLLEFYHELQQRGLI